MEINHQNENIVTQDRSSCTLGCTTILFINHVASSVREGHQLQSSHNPCWCAANTKHGDLIVFLFLYIYI